MEKFLSAILFLICSSLVAQDTVQKNFHSYVILSSEKNLSHIWMKHQSAWDPPDSVVENAFGKMKQGVDSFPNKSEAPDSLKNYNFQVVGFIDKSGHRVLYFNALCVESGLGGFNKYGEITRVLDGGACFFQVYYDVDEGKWELLSINGRA